MQAAWDGQGAQQLPAGSEGQQFISSNQKHNPMLAQQAKPHQGEDTFLHFALP